MLDGVQAVNSVTTKEAALILAALQTERTAVRDRLYTLQHVQYDGSIVEEEAEELRLLEHLLPQLQVAIRRLTSRLINEVA